MCVVQKQLNEDLLSSKFFLIKTAYQRAEAVQLKHCTTALKSKINNNKKRPNLSVDLTSKLLTRLQNNQDNINNNKKKQ